MAATDSTDTLQADPALPSAQDLREITQTGVDYIESWYTGDAARMRSCLHPDLVKRFVMRDPARETTVLRTTSADRMRQLTEDGEGTHLADADKTHAVTILDAFGAIACVKVVSHEYVDYLHLARFDERWLIVNALWAFRRLPPGP
jgi:hypothetical protein